MISPLSLVPVKAVVASSVNATSSATSVASSSSGHASSSSGHASSSVHHTNASNSTSSSSGAAVSVNMSWKTGFAVGALLASPFLLGLGL